MAAEDWRTVKALARELAHVPISEPQVRWWIFNAESNGLAGALIRRQGRIFIDKPAFERWLVTGQARPS